MRTPYDNLPAYNFHSRTIRGRHPSRFDPIAKTRFGLDRATKVMTMGSCFAQHLTRWLIARGFNVLLREQEIQAGGLFSANYGNVYTARQAVQLFDRAFDLWRPSDELYQNVDGRFFDPLRPSVSPEGKSSAEEVLADRSNHEKHVCEIFCEAQVLVFTLGLTEGWIRTGDQAVLPIAPGVVAGNYDPQQFSFRNFSYDEVLADLRRLVEKIASVNPLCKVLLTVSPVPLAATFEDRHISVSTMASKAVLRAAVEAILGQFPNVDYFPSFEIFYTPGIGEGYFDYDARHVLPAGVSHAMRLFERHYADPSKEAQTKSVMEIKRYAQNIQAAYMNINCDEGKIG